MEKHPVIEAQRNLIADLHRQVYDAEIELRGMEKFFAFESRTDAVDAVPRTPIDRRIERGRPSRSRTPNGKASGKQPGQLSMAWREILEYFYSDDAWFTDADAVQMVGELQGREIRPRAVKRLFKESYVSHGFLTERSDGRYRVTDIAAERFGFKRPPNGSSNMAAELLLNGSAASSITSSQEGGDRDATATTAH